MRGVTRSMRAGHGLIVTGIRPAEQEGDGEQRGEHGVGHHDLRRGALKLLFTLARVQSATNNNNNYYF